MAGFLGYQYVNDMCSSLFVDSCTYRFASDYLHHFLGSRKLSSLDGLFSRTYNIPCRFHGLSATQGQSRCGLEHFGLGVYCWCRNLSIFLSRSPTIGGLWNLCSLHSTRIRQSYDPNYTF
jgi:hypothetical protein